METNTTTKPLLAYNQPIAVTYGVDGSGIALRWLGFVAAWDGPDVLVRPDTAIAPDADCLRHHPALCDGPLRVVSPADICDRAARRDIGGDALYR